jgi:ribosomal protein S18 acetylase RimI-like enzyme
MTYRNYLMDYDDEQIIQCCRSTFTLDELALLRHDFDDPEVFWEIMRQDDKLIAFCAYGIADCSVDSWMIFWIGVDGVSRHCGHGTKILQQVERNIWNYGGKRIFLETSGRDEYKAARAFYLKNGYVESAVIKDYYNEHDDKVVYSKREET